MMKNRNAVAILLVAILITVNVPMQVQAAEAFYSEAYGMILVEDNYALYGFTETPYTQELVNAWQNDPYWDICGMPLDVLILLNQASTEGIVYNQNTGLVERELGPAEFAANINKYNEMKLIYADPTAAAQYQAQLQAQQQQDAAMLEAIRNQGIAVMQALDPFIQWANAVAPLGSYKKGSVYGPKLSQTELNEVKQAVEIFVGTYITPEMSDYQKICAINEYLSATCTYAPDWSKNRANTAWGALIYHEAQCSGYARATKALCDAVGIPCYYVHADNSSHQWNKVMIGGKWYVVDITNSVTCRNMLFLCSDATLTAITGDTSVNSGTPAAEEDYVY